MQKILGWIMLLVGMALLLVGFASPFATVIYATPTLTIYPSFPGGTQATPTLLRGGSSYTIEAYLTILDVGSLTIKQVDITDTGFTQTVPLTWASTKDYDVIRAVWTAPVLPDGTTLAFKWYVKTDKNYEATAYSYAKIGGPVGKFYINGLEANIDSVFTVSSPTLTFSFKATQQGDLIASVWILVKCDTPYVDQNVPMTETTADTEWTGTYTLPSRGTYTILGYISYGGKSYRLMNVFANLGVSEGFGLPKINTLQILGLASAGIGLVLVLFGKPR